MLALPVRARAQATLAMPEGVEAREGGGWRVAFRPGDAGLPAGAGPALAEIGRRLAARPVGTGRVTVEGQASGPADDPSSARRLALARALAVRQALVAGGLAETRVDVRPRGRLDPPRDIAEILPPEVPRSGRS
jgi:flagellar motor protein MotB